MNLKSSFTVSETIMRTDVGCNEAPRMLSHNDLIDFFYFHRAQKDLPAITSWENTKTADVDAKLKQIEVETGDEEQRSTDQESGG
ncbi:hypothetical protein E3N88_06054 [Mikania micrantha]|uniref:Uncharacterized protein n=1 Tax=Mikania micrantha TaxID=192012 RepID=A0A5N6PMR1_9ASTR|nr:hypothetical protein E3N88_06054 [Mikania micrantha]